MRDNFKKHREKGVVLIFSLFVVVLLSASIGILYMRAINETRLTQRNSDSFKAFTEAEAGVAFAYTIERANNFSWYTHLDRNTRGNPSPPGTVITIASIDPLTGYLQATGRRFSIKTYPEVIDTSATGVVIIHSQAMVNNITRTVERRLGQSSAYQYFFFFPTDHTFDTATFDGRNYGSIHVNGNIYFKGSPTFQFLTELSCGPNAPDTTDKGYFYRALKASFYDKSGEQDYTTTPGSLSKLDANMYLNTNYHFETGDTTFKFGPYPVGLTPVTLPSYLEGAAWNFQKYPSTTGTISPLHYTIGNEALKNVALYQIAGNPSYNLLSTSNNINLTINSTPTTDTEENVFKKIYSLPAAEQTATLWGDFWDKWKLNHGNDYANNHSGTGAFTDGPGTGGTINGTQLNRDWQRKFFWSIYRWGDNPSQPGVGIPDGVNREWWQDMNYGNDRTLDGMALAEYEDPNSGIPQGKYFLNTKEQSSAWGTWLQSSGLHQSGENKTQVKDTLHGGRYIDTGNIIGERFQDNALKEKAKNGGIYVNKSNEAYQRWLVEYNAAVKARNDDVRNKNYWYPRCLKFGPCSRAKYNNCKKQFDECWAKYWASGDGRKLRAAVQELLWRKPQSYDWVDSIIKGCVTEVSFYNAMNPAGCYKDSNNNYVSGMHYQPSNVLQIDLRVLRQRIHDLRPNFNGILYIDLNNYAWANAASNDENAVGVMLVNGERLPDGGLSVVTPHNVYIKGNYNLDPYGNTGINRTADDSSVIQNVIRERYAKYSYWDDYWSECTWCGSINNSLKWEPAEIITQRAIYTLSKNFNLPQTMPLIRHQYYQYQDENYGYTDADVVTHAVWGDPGKPWMPAAPTSTTPTGITSIDTWCQKTGKSLNWSSIANIEGASAPLFPNDTNPGTWGPYDWGGDQRMYADPTNNYYVLYNGLKGALYSRVYSNYNSTFAWDPLNPNEPNKFANRVVTDLTNYLYNNYIYNSAMITPYEVQGYNLEIWNSSGAKKIVNGAFIQLPESYKLDIPDEPYYAGTDYRRYTNPASSFQYESRFGRSLGAANTPRAGLVFGAGSSWREIRNDGF